MNPSEGVEREARRIADCRKISDEHGERIYKDVLDALTQAEKRGFERKQETLEAENKRLRDALGVANKLLSCQDKDGIPIPGIATDSKAHIDKHKESYEIIKKAIEGQCE